MSKLTNQGISDSHQEPGLGTVPSVPAVQWSDSALALPPLRIRVSSEDGFSSLTIWQWQIVPPEPIGFRSSLGSSGDDLNRQVARLTADIRFCFQSGIGKPGNLDKRKLVNLHASNKARPHELTAACGGDVVGNFFGLTHSSPSFDEPIVRKEWLRNNRGLS